MKHNRPLFLAATFGAAMLAACGEGGDSTPSDSGARGGASAASVAENAPTERDLDVARDLDPTASIWSCPPAGVGPGFDGEMLVFDDARQFAETFGCLAREGHAGATAAQKALRRFELGHAGYRSLRTTIADEEAALAARGALTRDNLPALKYFEDPTLQAIVNHDAKVKIGGEVIEVTSKQLGGGASSASKAQIDKDCCWMYRNISRQDDDGYGGVLISKAWVYNFTLPLFWFGVVGSSSSAYHATIVNGQEQLVPVTAELLGTGAEYTWSSFTCGANPADATYGDFDNNVSVFAHSDAWWTFSFPFFVTLQHGSSHVATLGNSMLYAQLSLCEPDPVVKKPFVSAALIQSNYGAQGNFEVVAARQGGGLQHFFRDNNAPATPWFAGAVFDGGAFTDVSLIQSSYGGQGNFEVVAAQQGGGLRHYFRDNDAPGTPWAVGATFGAGQFLSVSLIQSNYGAPGNFEVVAARQAGGLQHFFRNNSAPGAPWIAGPVFGGGQFRDVALIQSNFGVKGNFEVVAARQSGGLQHFFRNNDAPGNPWVAGPIFGAGQFEGVSLIQGNYGAKGNFEVVAARQSGGLQHFFRNNNVPALPWSAGAMFGAGPLFDAALIQSKLGTQGDFEVVAPRLDGALWHLRRENDLPGSPWTPGALF